MIKKDDINDATFYKKEQKDSLVSLANNIVNDPDKNKRLEYQLCTLCFYQESFGGAAISHKKCENCEVNQMYPSTVTDKLCLPCSKKLKVCKHCLADINLKNRRI